MPDRIRAYLLGSMYFYGQGVPNDDTQAFEWIQKAVEQKSHLYTHKAQYLLWYMYFQGRGTLQDLEMASLWYATNEASMENNLTDFAVDKIPKIGILF